MKITDIHNPWRDRLLPANFDNCPFHLEAGSREGGRRIVTHEFPKKDLPYSEDMGRAAINFTVRAYCISYPLNAADPLYMRDYQLARDKLQKRLDQGGKGTLQLPTLAALIVVCQRYRLTEEERFGGYCTFDMSFVEYGSQPFSEATAVSSATLLVQQAIATNQQILMNLAPNVAKISKMQ